MEDRFQRKKAVPQKLREFGFTEQDGVFSYRAPILDGAFTVLVKVDGAEVKTETVDVLTGEPYTLHLVEEAQGAFVGSVRQAYGELLDRVASCFTDEVFHAENARRLIAYAQEKYGTALEFLWSDLPDTAILRRQDTKKWYAVFMCIPRKKLWQKEEGMAEIVDMRILPEELDRIADGERYLRGYHMNKKKWFTMALDGPIPFEELAFRMDASYALAK